MMVEEVPSQIFRYLFDIFFFNTFPKREGFFLFGKSILVKIEKWISQSARRSPVSTLVRDSFFDIEFIQRFQRMLEKNLAFQCHRLLPEWQIGPSGPSNNRVLKCGRPQVSDQLAGRRQRGSWVLVSARGPLRCTYPTDSPAL